MRIFRGSTGICLVKVGDDDLLHLHHGLHGAIGLFAIGIAQVTAEGRGHNLPGQAEFVLEPSAFRFLAAVGDQSVPEVVHLFLAFDADEEGDSLVELVFWAGQAQRRSIRGGTQFPDRRVSCQHSLSLQQHVRQLVLARDR